MAKITRPAPELDIVIRINDAKIDRYLIDLLLGIQESSSISSAARALNSSYSYALQRIGALDNACRASGRHPDFHLIESRKGCGSALTEDGRQVVLSYQNLCQSLAEPLGSFTAKYQ